MSCRWSRGLASRWVARSAAGRSILAATGRRSCAGRRCTIPAHERPDDRDPRKPRARVARRPRPLARRHAVLGAGAGRGAGRRPRRARRAGPRLGGRAPGGVRVPDRRRHARAVRGGRCARPDAVAADARSAAAFVVVRGPKPTAALRSRGGAHRSRRRATRSPPTRCWSSSPTSRSTAARWSCSATATPIPISPTRCARAARPCAEVVTYRVEPAGRRRSASRADRGARRATRSTSRCSRARRRCTTCSPSRATARPADALRASLNRTRIASIGPVCSGALRAAGVRVDVEAHPPKLGPLMAAIEAALAA